MICNFCCKIASLAGEIAGTASSGALYVVMDGIKRTGRALGEEFRLGPLELV